MCSAERGNRATGAARRWRGRSSPGGAPTSARGVSSRGRRRGRSEHRRGSHPVGAPPHTFRDRACPTHRQRPDVPSRGRSRSPSRSRSPRRGADVPTWCDGSPMPTRRQTTRPCRSASRGLSLPFVTGIAGFVDGLPLETRRPAGDRPRPRSHRVGGGGRHPRHPPRVPAPRGASLRQDAARSAPACATALPPRLQRRGAGGRGAVVRRRERSARRNAVRVPPRTRDPRVRGVRPRGAGARGLVERRLGVAALRRAAHLATSGLPPPYGGGWLSGTASGGPCRRRATSSTSRRSCGVDELLRLPRRQAAAFGGDAGPNGSSSLPGGSKGRSGRPAGHRPAATAILEALWPP